jgi:hypothetical protein
MLHIRIVPKYWDLDDDGGNIDPGIVRSGQSADKNIKKFIG